MLNLINGAFEWIGDPVECYFSAVENGMNTFYKAFTYNGVSYQINDFVLFKTTCGTKLGKLLCTYESNANWHVQAKHRGIVKWYTKAADLPKIYTANIKYDAENEVVEDLRNTDTFVSLADILQKCILIFAHIEDPVYLVEDMKLNPMNYFSCRFKIKKSKLIPILDDISVTELTELNDIESTPKGNKIKKKANNENKQSGLLKSANKSLKISPFKVMNVVLTPNRAKRNLNESFDNTPNSQTETPVLNYSIVENIVDSDKPIRIKLKLSDVQRIEPSILLDKLDDDEPMNGSADVANPQDLLGNFKAGLKEPTVVLDRLDDAYVNQLLANDKCTDDDKFVKKMLNNDPSDEHVDEDDEKCEKCNSDEEDNSKDSLKDEVVVEVIDRPRRAIKIAPEIELRRSSRQKSRKSYADFISPVKTTPRKKRLQSTDSDIMVVNDTPEKKNVKNEPIQKTPSKRTRIVSVTFDDADKQLTPLKKITGTPTVTSRPKRNVGKPIKYNQDDFDEYLNKVQTPKKKRSELNEMSTLKNCDTPKTKTVNDNDEINVNKRSRSLSRKTQQQEDDDCIDELNKILYPLKIYGKTEFEDLGLKELEPNKISPLRIKRTPGRTKRYHIEEDTINITPSVRSRTRKLSEDSTTNGTPSTRTRTRKLSEDSETSLHSPRKRANCTPSKYKDIYTTPKKAVRDIIAKTPKNTPSAKMKLIREGVITPSMQCRKTAVVSEGTPLNKAREKLHVSYVPDALPCREREFADILSFVQGKLLDGCGGCMYVSGVPGTGKTATVTEVIRNLQEMVKNRDLPDFNFVTINGMRLTEPRQSYVEILKQLTGKTVAWEQAQSMLDARFTKNSKKNQNQAIVMLVDELDILCTKRQDVVYNLLDWPTKATAQLIVITIANTMDLPERLLMGRVTSRLGLTRLTFQAYTHKQLQEIVMRRLMGTNAFNPDAIQLVARKVASVSGDARRALDICRRSAEIAEAEGPRTLVSMAHVNEALNAMITQPKVRAIKRCSRLEQLILQSVVAEVERTGVDETTFADVYTMLSSVAGIDGFQIVSVTLALAAVSRLGASRLLLTDQKSNDIHQRLILNVSADDIYYALRKD